MQHQTIVLKENLDLNSSAPLYIQIANILRQKINDGSLKVGDSLPAEMLLCKGLGLSRSTIRNAFALLEQEGKIIRKRGLGTIVCEPKLRRNLDTLYNFSSEMRVLGITPSSDVISFETIKPNSYVAEQLNISNAADVYKIYRLRKGDGKPLLLEEVYIPTVYLPHLTKNNLGDSLYAMISQHTGTFPSEATETYEAIVLSEKEAKLLCCQPCTPAFRIQRVSKNSNGDIFEYSIIIAPGNRNKYEITLYQKNIAFQNAYRRIV